MNITIIDGQDQQKVSALKGDNLLDVIRKFGKNISAPCGGKGTCKKCTVTIVGHGPVLACQHAITEDITVTLPEAKQAHILSTSSSQTRAITFDSGITINEDNNLYTVKFDGTPLTTLTQRPEVHGIAVDIGTTTVVVYLVNLQSYTLIDVASFINPQTAFGHDVISRINFTIENPDGLETLKNKIITAISSAITEVCKRNAVDAQSVFKITIAGNTTMLHLLMGENPASIAFAPFTPVFIDKKQVSAATMGFPINPNGVVIIIPSIAAYVGADIVAGVASVPILEAERFSLFIDIGTNGEMAIGNKDVIYSCATAAGPAFEGANIQCGIGGVEGALSVYKDHAYRTIGNKKITGICGSGLIDVIANLVNEQVVDMTGYMENNFVVEHASNTATGHDIIVTPQDVREVQLAKAAIFAGIVVLMKNAGVGYDDIEHLYLAGAFGNYMDIESATRIGLLPVQLKDKVVPIGNSAGTGARLLLESIGFEQTINAVVKKSKYIELSMRADFNDAYTNAMFFE